VCVCLLACMNDGCLLDLMWGFAARHMSRVGQNLVCTPYMTVCMVISLPKVAYTVRYLYRHAPQTFIPPRGESGATKGLAKLAIINSKHEQGQASQAAPQGTNSFEAKRPLGEKGHQKEGRLQSLHMRMHTHTHTRTHTLTHTQTHTHAHKYITHAHTRTQRMHTYIRARTQTNTHVSARTHIHTCMGHVYIPMYTHTRTYTRTHSHVRAHTHTYAHAHKHKHAQTCTHAHVRAHTRVHTHVGAAHRARRPSRRLALGLFIMCCPPCIGRIGVY